jgi:hypothetical protein
MPTPDQTPANVSYSCTTFTDYKQARADYTYALGVLEAMRELAHRRMQETGQNYLLNREESLVASQLEHLRDQAYNTLQKEPK